MAKSALHVLGLASPETNPLIPTGLRQDITDLTGSLVLLQTYSRVASQQAVIDPTLIGPDAGILSSLKQHQIIARHNAEFLNSAVCPRILENLTDVLAYSHTMSAFTKALMPLLPNITANPAARQQALSLLAQMDLEAGRRQSTSSEAATQLHVMVGKVDIDNRNFAADAAEAGKEVSSGSGALADLQKQISDLQKKISGEIAGVVVSALVVVAGGVIIAVGALATLPTAAISTSVILGGVSVVVAGSIALTTAAANLGADNSRLADLYQRSAALNTTLTVVKAIAAQVQSLSDVTAGLSTSVATLNTQWAAIRSGISTFRSDLANASDASDVAHAAAAVTLAQKDWQSIAEQSQSLLSRLMEMTPQDVKDVLKPPAPAVAA